MLNLHTLCLNRCEALHADFFQSVCFAPSLTSLSIPHNNVTDADLFPLTYATNLCILDIDCCCKLTDACLLAFSNSTSMTSFHTLHIHQFYFADERIQALTDLQIKCIHHLGLA
jgi:hypothetical protein